jgi:putative NIF3 family GTP cyclohydrolase 1 type 2
LFRPVQSVAADTPKGGLIHRLGRAGVAHFAAHTNADRAVGGVNDALAATLGIRDVRPLEPAENSASEGLGRIGELRMPMTARKFAAHVAASLPATVTGARLAGDPERPVRRVAVCGGSGGSLLDTARATGADIFVTADLSHHVAAEYAADPANPALVDVSHWASEWPWLPVVAALLADRLGVRTVVSERRTDPWTDRVG